MNIKTVTVIGANGTMGRNVSAIFASFGNAKVYMVSRTLQKSEEAKEIASKLVKAECIKNNLIPCDYSDLPKCLTESNLVFESVAENFDVKMEVNKLIASCAKKDAYLCTGTSGLSITKLAECFDRSMQKNYMGVHMFNPPYNMILCELVPTKYTDKEQLESISVYLNETLRRTVVQINDSPAFLGNRIGFQFINEAVQAAEKYQYEGGIDYIDTLLGGFTGRAMAPILTADFVGLDVHASIVNNLYDNSSDYAHETFVLPYYVQELINCGKLGRKTKCGLYKNEIDKNGNRENFVYDIASKTYRAQKKYEFNFIRIMIEKIKIGKYSDAFSYLVNDSSKEAKITLDFILKYIIYSVKTVSEIAFDAHAADDVMATGFNWCPPLALVDALGGKEEFISIARGVFSAEFLNIIDFDKVCDNIFPSKYDYRKFIKAKK